MFLRKTFLAAFCATTLLPLTAVYAADVQQFPSEQGSITVTPIAKGLDHPWALAFLPDRQGFLVTERPGHLRFVSPDGKLSAPLSGVPEVWPRGRALA